MSVPEVWSLVFAGIAPAVSTLLALSRSKSELRCFAQYLMGATVVGYSWLFVAIDIGFDRVASEGLMLWPRYGWWGLLPVVLTLPYIMFDEGFRQDVFDSWWMLVVAIAVLLVPILAQVAIALVAIGTTVGTLGTIIQLVAELRPRTKASTRTS